MKVILSILRILPAMLLLVFSGGCSKKAADPASAGKAGSTDPAIAVSVFKIQPEKINRTVELVGTLEGKQEVTISSEVAARVIAVQADLGDLVQVNQSIVELDPTEFRLAVERQQSALFQVLAQLGVRKETDPLPEASQTSIVRKALADLADAKSTFERTKELVAKAVESKAAYDAAEARYQAAQANYTASQDQVRNLLAQVDNVRSQLALAKKKLGDCTIRAPFSGTVKERLVEVGQYVREQTAVMSIATMNPLKLLANVPEPWFPYVGPGAAMELTVDAYTDQFPCKVNRVSRAVDPQTRTFSIEAFVDNSRGKLRSGLFARASLTTSKVDSVIRVPASAVVSFYGVQKVFAVESGQIQERVVKLGDRTGDVIEVTQGLNAGDRIATSELARIQQGSRVQVREEN
jgi:multidrug efflux pump subunit AcrA (membrane-fusion protein)